MTEISDYVDSFQWKRKINFDNIKKTENKKNLNEEGQEKQKNFKDIIIGSLEFLNKEIVEEKKEEEEKNEKNEIVVEKFEKINYTNKKKSCYKNKEENIFLTPKKTKSNFFKFTKFNLIIFIH